MRAARLFLPAAVLLTLAILWELVVWGLEVPKWIVPSPSAIWQAFWEMRALLGVHVAQTMLEVAIGIGIAVTAGVSVAAAINFSPLLQRAIYPLLVISQTVPILALAPLLIIWFGFGIAPKVIVVTLFCFFPIAVNTSDGLTSTEPRTDRPLPLYGSDVAADLAQGAVAGRSALLLFWPQNRSHLQCDWRHRWGVGWRQTGAGNLHAALVRGVQDRTGLFGHCHHVTPEHHVVSGRLCTRARHDALAL